MTVPYLIRMALLCLAAFSLVYVAAGACIAMLARVAVPASERMKASTGARLLLAMRLAPAGVGLLVVLALCIPSYLWLEPDGDSERVNFLCLAAAAFSVAIWIAAIVRTGRVILDSVRWPEECAGPLIALVGVIRPRVVVSGDVRSTLPADELSAALRHEEAHRIAHDNFKRLLILMTPGSIPGLEKLEKGWATLAEWAADDRAAQGDACRAVTLAGALVRVAKMGTGTRSLGLATQFAASGRDLETRVDRLLNGSTVHEPHISAATFALGSLLTASLVFVMFQPALYSLVHELLEVFTS